MNSKSEVQIAGASSISLNPSPLTLLKASSLSKGIWNLSIQKSFSEFAIHLEYLYLILRKSSLRHNIEMSISLVAGQHFPLKKLVL